MHLFKWLLPKSLLGQVTLVMLIGVIGAQSIGNIIWTWQAQATHLSHANTMAQQIATAADNSIIYFKRLPVNFRSVVMQQMREMGGLRYLVMYNNQPVPMHKMAENELQTVFNAALDKRFNVLNGGEHHYQFWFSEPSKLIMNDKGSKLTELPASWTQFSLLLEPTPAPVLVIQTQLEDGQWLLLSTLLPDPYFFDKDSQLSLALLTPQLASILGLLIVCLLAVNFITRPLAKLSRAAENFGKGLESEPLPKPTNREIAKTVQAFHDMRERIQRYITDRERLFSAISHDLRTPITRLKLRAELLDDEATTNQFHEDLDELDLMVKSALQSVKETDIHENHSYIDLASFLVKLAAGFNLTEQRATVIAERCMLSIKPLAMKRALSNIIDNGIKYGQRVSIELFELSDCIEIVIRDFGPGVSSEQIETLCKPYVRLEHGKRSGEGYGLGLSIAKTIINGHGGEIYLHNHDEVGLIVTCVLPKSEPSSN